MLIVKNVLGLFTYIFRLVTIIIYSKSFGCEFKLLIGSRWCTDRSPEEPVSMKGYVEEGSLGLSTEVEGRILSTSVIRNLLCLK